MARDWKVHDERCTLPASLPTHVSICCGHEHLMCCIFEPAQVESPVLLSVPTFLSLIWVQGWATALGCQLLSGDVCAVLVCLLSWCSASQLPCIPVSSVTEDSASWCLPWHVVCTSSHASFCMFSFSDLLCRTRRCRCGERASF